MLKMNRTSQGLWKWVGGLSPVPPGQVSSKITATAGSCFGSLSRKAKDRVRQGEPPTLPALTVVLTDPGKAHCYGMGFKEVGPATARAVPGV